MVSNITYRLSAFSDYSLISYNKEDVIKILSDFTDVILSPTVISEVLSGNVVSQRMQFLAQNGLLLITILSERIDIQVTSNRKDGFQPDEIEDVKRKLGQYMELILNVFSNRVSSPYRLAWFTSYVCFEQTVEEKNAFRDKFLKELNFFKTNRIEDMIARFGAQRTVEISGREETLNVLLTVNRHIIDQGTDMEVDGYKADYDINTWQGNRVNRFSIEGMKEFVEKAFIQQEALNEEVLS